MDKMSEDSVRDIETLLDEYVVKKLDVASDLKQILEHIENFREDNFRKIKELSSNLNTLVDDVASINKSIDDITDDLKTEIQMQKSIENSVKKNGDSIKALELSVKEKMALIESEIASNKKENKVIKILAFVIGSINILILGITIIGLIKLFD